MGVASTMSKLILVVNPGSSSRKYALYDGSLALRATIHIEQRDNALGYTFANTKSTEQAALELDDISEASNSIVSLFIQHGAMTADENIGVVGLRVVAPGGYFLHDHIVDESFIEQLTNAKHKAPLHIEIVLQELSSLKNQFNAIPIVAVSDSAFHSKKPVYAWNYGINIHDADKHDIKRFGYHGLSVESVVNTLWSNGKLPPKVIVCHLGSGSSVTGVYHGRTIDTTMGYSPLEGVIMATRSGSIDPTAVKQLQRAMQLDDEGIENYLQHESGLKGLAGSNDIRELIERESDGDHFAHLGLTTLVHSIHKAIGGMLVAMNGADAIVFTGTVGERSAILRKRIVAHLQFFDFILDGDANDSCLNPTKSTLVSQQAQSRPVFVIPTNESHEIAKHVLNQIK
jgi:acetate kinase